jgi:type IV pilus assembly protein PilV
MTPRSTAGCRALAGHRKGFTLVEVLVALVVFTVGMLGIAGMFVISLQSGGSAINRTQAISLATSLADAIRANRSAGATYVAGAAVDNACINGTLCSIAQMAQHDLFIWSNRVTQSLPGATWTVARAGGPALFSYTVTLNWNDSGNRTATYALNFQI